ncbi:RNA polymerase sigma factor region1.1 domain-containing protein [Microvirga sp. 0TCS3.31]
MTGWQTIATAPRETGRPLLLYPYPYLRGRRRMESQHPEYRPLLDLNDRAVARMIKLAKRRGYVMYDVLKGLMPPEVFAQREIKDVIDQFAEMGINVVGEPEAMRAPEAPVEGERSPDNQPEAPQPAASVPEEPPIAYSNVFEGYWDDTGWRTAGGVPCEPTHWMPLPPPPLTLVSL